MTTVKTAATTGSSVAVAVIIAWAWNNLNPNNQMPAEVAAAVGGLLGPLVDQLTNLWTAALARVRGGQDA